LKDTFVIIHGHIKVSGILFWRDGIDNILCVARHSLCHGFKGMDGIYRAVFKAWGKDTINWVGETGQITIVEQLSFGKLVNIIVVKPMTHTNKAALAATQPVS